ncbi:MAG TPA: UDP-N-acetylmuramoyl-L-alanyl-D-glutamate--2,6-diaminopimelate ligase [Candidatus Paceibacterota bacterium]|nr:UDP-N-acetylmuramoyl-L-alanyl-D-glutamate--2,6-diaminopimelate ligase [Candidatus Paceibacterota bacterium]
MMLLKKLKIKRRMITWLSAMHFFGNPSAKMKIVGVTGTNGKTTTTTLLYDVAMALGHKSGLIGTVENRIGEERLPATHTTPDPLNLNKLLKKMAEAGCEYVFMEVSSHALDQKRTAGVAFAGAVFTNLTHDHLDYHQNVENYFNAKKKLFKYLPATSFAISNVDDPYGEKILEGISGRKFSYGFDKKADYYGKIDSLNFSGLQLEINSTPITSKLIGKFNAYNILAVWSVCNLLGFDMKKVAEIFKGIKPPNGRFEHFVSPTGALVIIDYAHTPDALLKVLLTANEIKCKGSPCMLSTGAPRLISLAGCGGDRDPMKREKMGRIAAELSDISIFTSDNPRNEDPSKIIEEMKTSLTPDLLEKVKTIPDRREAIIKSVRIAKEGDIILCAGKGHEDYQEIEGVKHHFNDLEEYKKAYEK